MFYKEVTVKEEVPILEVVVPAAEEVVKVEWEPVVQEPSMLGDIAHYLMMPMLFLLPFSDDDDITNEPTETVDL